MEQKDINSQIHALLEDLNLYGMKSEPRGHKVVEANLAMLEVDPLKAVMNFKNRDFDYKYFAGELAWYFKRTNSVEFINNFSSFWKIFIADDQGKINSNYGYILLGDHPSTVDHSYNPSARQHGQNQLSWVYESLVKDKDSRQAVAFLNCPYYQYEGNKDFVCTMYLNFWIRKDHIDMKVQMRSNDIFFGLTYDAPWFSLIHQTMYLNLKKHYPNLKLGVYYHCADNIHYYERHFDLVKKILSSEPLESPKFELQFPLFTFDEKFNLSLSPEAESYARVVEETVNLKKDANVEDWKHILNYLIDFGV